MAAFVSVDVALTAARCFLTSMPNVSCTVNTHKQFEELQLHQNLWISQSIPMSHFYIDGFINHVDLTLDVLFSSTSGPGPRSERGQGR